MVAAAEREVAMVAAVATVVEVAKFQGSAFHPKKATAKLAGNPAAAAKAVNMF